MTHLFIKDKRNRYPSYDGGYRDYISSLEARFSD